VLPPDTPLPHVSARLTPFARRPDPDPLFVIGLRHPRDERPVQFTAYRTPWHCPYTASVSSGDGGSFELGTDGPTTILVGVDDSTTSLRAASYAAGLARRQGARVTVVYVAPVGSPAAAAPGGAALIVAQRDASDEIASDMRRRAAEVSQELGISVTVVAARGDPFTELSRVAKEIRADAIVVGASTKAGHRLIGSLAVRLVRAGKWPVTVVP
jgi:nucleotide-binding universal stress UspA family protein